MASNPYKAREELVQIWNPKGKCWVLINKSKGKILDRSKKRFALEEVEDGKV